MEKGVEEDEGKALPILEAKNVYILMSKDHRISRNRRAEWFFSRFGTTVTLPKDAEISSVGESADFQVVSAIPKDPPQEWSPQTRHSFKYKIMTNTVVTYLSRRYRIVYCIDVSPSVAAVDVQAGTVVFDRIFQVLRSSLDGLMRPFYIPGSTTIFQPKIFITVITHSPFVTYIDDEVILQGKLLGPSTYGDILKTVFERLNSIENKMADMTSSILHNIESVSNNDPAVQDGDEDPSAPSKSSIAISSDFSLVDLLKQALIALSLLPENSSSGLVILTDGVVSVPDGRYLDIILSQLRYNTVSCSFIQLSSPFHPHLCHGALPYADLMRFIASATFGAFLTEAPDIANASISEMNVYHLAFLAWSFQSSESNLADSLPPAAAKPGEWSIRNKCFFTVRDMPIVKKQQYENSLSVDYMKVLSCRLREGFMIKEINLAPDGQCEIKLTLPWKFLIHLEYILVTNKATQTLTECILSLEGPYDFLHDVTCLAGRSFPSFYRQLMVNRFWATRKNLSESDRLLVHLNSFSSNPAFYNIPDSLRNGVPLFYFSANSSVPVLQSSDFPYQQFTSFWKPVCMLDTTVWQKWMHTHRIGIILEHDHPLPKHLHFPNSTGRFNVVLCRQAIMALNTLLKNMSSFVLVENHSYVTLMHNEKEKAPFSFYIIRVTSKPPYVVLRLAFLVGTPGNLRHQTVSLLREKIATLTFPQRLKEPPRWRFPSNQNTNTSDQSNKATWSDMPCCILMQKPIEKILIRYEKIPENFCKVLMPQHVYESGADNKSSSSKQSTFGFRPTHPSPWAATSIMVPEVFNTVARYLHHRRWIWWFPKTLLPQLHLKDAAEILSIVTKMRLQEGFRFAYSSAGTVSMVLEVQMQNETSRPAHELSEFKLQATVQETYCTPCVLQFVVFPPSTSLTRNFEGDFEAFEDANDLYFITECWVEPQCGKISGCQFAALNGLEFLKVPDKIFQINEECFLTLGTFEYLRGICANDAFLDYKAMGRKKASIHKLSSLYQNNITIMPFEFELGRILPKCQQSEILFSMFFQDLKMAFSIKAGNEFLPFHEKANEILHNTWSANLVSVHDREILVDSKQYEDLLKMVLSREDISNMGPETKCSNAENLPAWRCFVRAVDNSQLLITLMPKTLRDTKLLFLMLEKCKCVMNESETKLESPMQTLQTLLGDSETETVDNQGTDKKIRQRKTSEPNCGLKPGASNSLTASLALEMACITGGRKRIRALSGGESAPVLKKAFRVDSTFNEILTLNFFHETSSKYIVPKEENTIIKQEFQCEEIRTNNAISKSEYITSIPIPDISDLGDTNSEPPASEGSANSSLSSQSMFGSLTMPLFVYDCSLSTLRNHVIFKGSSDIVDSCLDFRIFENANILSDLSDNPAASSNADNMSNDPEIPIQEHCKELQLAYKIAFIQSVFQSLQLGYYISTEDLKAVISLCHKDSIAIDISEFLKCVCMHVSNPEESCQSMTSIHSFIQKKFQEIIRKDFNFIKVDSNLFFYRCFPIHRSYENVFSSGKSDKSMSASISECIDFGEREKTDTSRYSESEKYRISESSQRRESEGKDKTYAFPLFMYIKCTVTNASGIVRSSMISDLPVCLDNFDPTLITDFLNSTNPETSKSNVKLELVFLTCPTAENPEKINDSVEISDKTQGNWFDLPHHQLNAVKNAVTEIQWLLDDEITSFRSKSNTLTCEILKEIAAHVEKSAGKLGCFQQSIPLKFVSNENGEGYNNFIQRFNNLSVDGFALKKLETWWYLMGNALSNFTSLSNSNEKLNTSEINELMTTTITNLTNFEQTSKEIGSSTSLNLLSDKSSEVGSKSSFLLPFWMIFRVEEDYVISYCHCRYNEENLNPLQQCKDIRELIINAVVGLVRIVNQDLLLQSLHDTRLCSPLLEPEAIKQSYDISLFCLDDSDCAVRTESDAEGQAGHNIPGMFSCDVVWETTFKLHPRLGSGPGKSAFSRGIQILRSTLVAFEVANRENLFVYRNTKGHVFYLRLHRVYEPYEDLDTGLTSENPSPRSSISSRSRGTFDMIELQSKEDMMFGISKEPPTGGPRDRLSDAIVLLKVHGITEAGTEIKEHLIQSLRNKLDDAVLDVLSVTLDRNPHCKLTPEDVHFIQKPKSVPDAVVKFTTGRFTKLLLPAFAFYLHQNLLQFLNIPKYTKNELDYHFQDYFRATDGQIPEEQNVYLYNQSPGGTGSRGVACVSVALMNKSGTLIRNADWKRPSDFLFSLKMVELSTFIETEEITRDNQLSDVYVELCVWKQGRINLDILKNNFASAVKHGGWDLAMEFQVLTPSLHVESTVSVDPEKHNFISGNRVRRSTSPTSVKNNSQRCLKRRNSSASTFNADTRDGENREEFRSRAWSYTTQKNLPTIKDVKLNLLPPLYINKKLENAMSSETIRSGQDFITARRNIVEDYNKLHINYATLLKRWCSLGFKMSVPGLRVVSISLKPRYYLNETLEELVKLVHSVAPDNSTAQFWKLSKNVREFLTIGDTIYPKYRGVLDKACKEASALKLYEKKFKSLERKDESEYPEELLKLFKTQEHFQPSNSQNLCVLIARNIAHWEACVTNRRSSDPTFQVPEVMKSMYKFSPLISEAVNTVNDDRSSINTEKLRLPIRKGLLALLGDANDDGTHSILIPRQRFLLVTLSKCSIEFIFYNWSKESSDKLTDQTKLLARWTQSRMQLLSTVLLQKSGLFYNQPFLRKSRGQDPIAPAFGGADLKDLVLSPCPIKTPVGVDNSARKKVADAKTTSQLSDIYRNLHHAHMLQTPEDIICSPIKAHGEQILSILSSGKKDIESALFRYWLSRGPSASNVIGMEAIEALKQTARTIHYCMTPIFFLPRWRNAVGLTRDSSVGLFKRGRVSESDSCNMVPPGSLRDRRCSESSGRSSQLSNHKSRIWSVWKRLYSAGTQEEDWIGSPSQCRNSRKTEEAWHYSLCNTFIQEYMQYLQTLGFIPTHSNIGIVKRKQPMLTSENWAASYAGRMERIRRMSDGSVWSSESERSSSSLALSPETQINKMDKDEKVFYLQKSLPGGIILLEVGLQEPFCYCKIHALEAHRIQPNKVTPKAATSHNTLVFVDECDKMKISMHLHSFAYDFHLRSVHSYVCGKQQIFKPGYHVTKFLDDFISYYCKGPNFARNTVHIGAITMQNVSTPSHILFNYILSHDQTYHMKVMRMVPVNSTRISESQVDPPAEYILVYNLSKKIEYKESEDESHIDEFDMSLLIAHDAPSSVRPYSVDPSVLRMKFYIVLTSRRELYPKIINDPNSGKLYPVTAPEPLSTHQSRPDIHRISLSGKLVDLVEEPTETENVASANQNNLQDVKNSEQDGETSKTLNTGPDGIREEKVLYMGFFSSHEQMMQEIVVEQTKWAENFIHTVIGKAAVDCRRDLLWQRLLVGGRAQESLKLKKDDLTIRETVGILTYWEFSELLELVHLQPLREMDSRLKTLLNQPLSFFQSLINLMKFVNQYQHRYFVAPDGSVHQLAIVNPNINKSVVMIELNLEKQTSDISLLFKEIAEEEPPDLDPEIVYLIEAAVGACCYCNWINIL